MSFKSILQISLTTMATMFILNTMGSQIPIIRGLIRSRNGLTVVGGTDAANGNGLVGTVTEFFT